MVDENIDNLDTQNVEKYSRLIVLLEEVMQLLIDLGISTFTFDLAQNNIFDEIEKKIRIEEIVTETRGGRRLGAGRARTPKLLGIESIINRLGPNDFITIETAGRREINTIQKLLFDFRNRRIIPQDITSFSVDNKELIIITGAFDPERGIEIAHIK